MSPERINWQHEPKRPERNLPGDTETSSSNGVTVDVNKLIHLTEGHPVLREPLEQYMGRLEVDCWGDANGNTFTPRSLIELLKQHGDDEVIRLYPEYERHVTKIREADYSFPIHVYQDWVINGAHRLSKLVLDQETGKTTQDFITVKELREIPKEAITEWDLVR